MNNISVKILKIDLRSYCVQMMCVTLVRLYVVTWQQRAGLGLCQIHNITLTNLPLLEGKMDESAVSDFG